MPRTRDESEQLGTRQHEVEDLREEEQQECFREMRLYTDDAERHPGDVAQRVAGKHARGVPSHQSCQTS